MKREERNVKRVYVLAALAAAAIGSTVFAVACISDEPGFVQSDAGKDTGQPDAVTPPTPDSGDPDSGGPLPKSIDGLILWLDGNDPDSIERKNPNSALAVTKWLDKSGTTWTNEAGVHRRDFEAPTPSAAPQFAVASMNSKSTIFFQLAGNQYLQGPTFAGMVSSIEAFIVFKTLESNVDGGLVDYGLWLFGQWGSLHPTQAKLTRECFGSTGLTIDSIDKVPQAELFEPRIMGISSKPGAYIFYHNGGSWPGNTAEHRGVDFKAEGSILGATNGYRSDIVPTAFFNGYIAEVIFYDRVLAPRDHDAVQSYLATKWGIALKDGGL